MSHNTFDCLSNALLQAGLRCELPIAFTIPEHVREMVEGIDVRQVCAVTVHQCPPGKGSKVNYHLEVHLQNGSQREGKFQGAGEDPDSNTYVLYDRHRDGMMKHMHLLH